MQITQGLLDSILSALGEQLTALGSDPHELAVIGGSALLALRFLDRATKDVDVVAFVEEGRLRSADPFPDDLREARDRVARDFDLDENWLNPGPKDLLIWGLPDGFQDRLTTRSFGTTLTVHFAGRLDQIHFKLFAMTDQRGGRHEADLRALEPSREELIAAARWTTAHDPSPGFRSMLLEALRRLGVEDVDLEP